MISLVLDSSNKELLVGLFKDNIKISLTNYKARQNQSELMIPEIDNILKKNNLNPKEINEIIVTNGPGSYTGIRIALTIAKIYAYSLNLPCYVVSSLNILTSNNFNKETICLINARSNRSYIGIYKGKEVILKDSIKTNEEVLSIISSYKDYLISGDLDYLNLKGINVDKALNMINLKDKNNLSIDNKNIKAVYLKD